MDINLPIKINPLAVFFNAGAVTEWGHLATILRFTTKCYIITSYTDQNLNTYMCIYISIPAHTWRIILYNERRFNLIVRYKCS